MAIDFFSKNAFLFWYLVGINLFTLLLYASDKISARAGAWRVRERTLLVLALVGGSAGALVGMQLFRHKTRKASFLMLLAVVLLMQLAVGVFVFKTELNTLFDASTAHVSVPRESPQP